MPDRDFIYLKEPRRPSFYSTVYVTLDDYFKSSLKNLVPEQAIFVEIRESGDTVRATVKILSPNGELAHEHTIGVRLTRVDMTVRRIEEWAQQTCAAIKKELLDA